MLFHALKRINILTKKENLSRSEIWYLVQTVAIAQIQICPGGTTSSNSLNLDLSRRKYFCVAFGYVVMNIFCTELRKNNKNNQ